MHTPEALAKHFIAYNAKVCVMNLFFTILIYLNIYCFADLLNYVHIHLLTFLNLLNGIVGLL